MNGLIANAFDRVLNAARARLLAALTALLRLGAFGPHRPRRYFTALGRALTRTARCTQQRLRARTTASSGRTSNQSSTIALTDTALRRALTPRLPGTNQTIARLCLARARVLDISWAAIKLWVLDESSARAHTAAAGDRARRPLRPTTNTTLGIAVGGTSVASA